MPPHDRRCWAGSVLPWAGLGVFFLVAGFRAMAIGIPFSRAPGFGDGGGALSLRVWRWRSPCGRGVGTRLEFRVNLLRGLMCTRLGSTDASAYALPVAVASKQTHVCFADEVEERREDAISLQLFRIPWTFNIIRSSRIREFPRDKPFSTPLIAVEQDTLLQDASTHKFVQLHLRRPKNLGEVAAPR